MNTEVKKYDVAIVGAGPVGLTIANTLGLYGVKTLIIEKLNQIIDYPRAIGIDDEALRTIQATGLAEQVKAHITPDHAMILTDASGRVFAQIDPRVDDYGWSRRNAFIQPQIDNILYQGLGRFENVEVLLGHEVQSFTQGADSVRLNVLNQNGQETSIEAGWVVAADGGNSALRRTLGIAFEGRTKPNQWIVVDVRNDPIGTPHVYLHCEAERPYVSAALPHGIRRFEFMVMPGETEEELSKPENLAKLMEKVVSDPDKVDYIRKRVYTHNARLAKTFRSDRVLLAGDAAHIMPVWQGQGYNSGLRDASNLAWKLAYVVKGIASDRLLDTYEQERREHARMMIHLSEVFGDVMAPPNPKSVYTRDRITRMLNLVPQAKQYLVEMRFKPMPRYEKGAIVSPKAPVSQHPRSGFLDTLLRQTGDTPMGRLLGLISENKESFVGRMVKSLVAPEKTPVGRMFLQPKVLTEDGQVRLFNDVIGLNFAVVAWATDPTFGLTPEARHLLDRLGAKFVTVKPDVQMAYTADQRDGVICVGDIGNRLKKWFEQWPQSVVFVRPDRFVGAICSPQDISETTLAFAQALSMRGDKL